MTATGSKEIEVGDVKGISVAESYKKQIRFIRAIRTIPKVQNFYPLQFEW